MVVHVRLPARKPSFLLGLNVSAIVILDDVPVHCPNRRDDSAARPASAYRVSPGCPVDRTEMSRRIASV